MYTAHPLNLNGALLNHGRGLQSLESLVCVQGILERGDSINVRRQQTRCVIHYLFGGRGRRKGCRSEQVTVTAHKD